MLPRSQRVVRGDEFRHVMRRGRSAGRRLLVVHALLSGSPEPARVGFVVGRSVGPSVVRHRVSRRLRHLARARLAAAPDGTLLVVRARPAAASAVSVELGADLDAALHRLGLPSAPVASTPGTPAPDMPAPATGRGPDQGRNR